MSDWKEPEVYSNNKTEQSNIKHIFSKYDFDLYDEAKSLLKAPLFRVKKIGATLGKEKWKLYKDNELILVVDSTKFTKAESGFLRSTNGFSFLLNAAKQEVNSINALKKLLKLELKKT